MPAEHPTVVLVEDETVTRSAVRRLLEGDGFIVVAEASSFDEGLEVTMAMRPEICLVGVDVPGGGIRVASEVNARLPETVVVMLTASEDHDDLIDSIRAGASGYLLKSMDPERITAALHGVLAGEAAIPRSLMTHIVNELQTQGRRRVIAGRKGRAELSSREWEVLDLMCSGLAGPQIAERLGLSPVTVRRHAAAVVGKLGVADRAEAIALVKGTGL